MELDDLNRMLKENNLTAYWIREGVRPEFKPYLWKWSKVYPTLLRAGEMVPLSTTVEMRTVGFKNPGLAGKTTTISLDYQILMPGEKTRAHRNLKSETRFVVKGSAGASFIVDGESFPMEEGDLIITPNWSWHDHYNGGGEPVIWIDGLDMGLVNLAVEINERYSQGQQPVERPAGYSAKLWGYARPSWIKSDLPTPPFRYPWKETYATLLALKESDGDPFDGIHLRYAHPVNGGATLPTFSCEIQLLRPGEKTQAHRHNSTTYYHVFRGEGATVVSDERLEWAQGDIFVVPPWSWHNHENRLDQDAILFSISDWPTMTALGFYREERR